MSPPATGESVSQAADSLLVFLRSAGYSVDIGHRLRVQRLLTLLAAEKQLPANAAGLGGWVRPLVCQSPRDQELFSVHFDDWLKLQGETPPPPPPPAQFTVEVLEDVHRARRLTMIVAAALLIVAAAALVLSRGSQPATALRVQPRSNELPATPSNGYGGTIFLWPLPAALCALLGYSVWYRFRVRAYLIQRQTSGAASGAGLFVGNMQPVMYDSRLLASAARGLGSYTRVPSTDLNIPESVVRTAKEAGRFTPVEADRPTVPEYLILLDRSSSVDFFACFAEGIVRSLEASNISVEQYYFHRAPSQCYSQRGHSAVSIQVLAERFPDHRLLVFSDGAGFLSGTSSECGPWMEVISTWSNRTLVTPVASEYWGHRERVIAGAEWKVISATQESLAAFALGEDPPRTEEGEFVPGVPEFVRNNERRLLQRAEPRPQEIRDLLEELRVGLGSAAFQWLCACAPCPVPDWNVALYLGHNLMAPDGRPLLSEPRLMALAELPWFREGRMPNWVRLALLGQMSAPQERATRNALNAMLARGSDSPIRTYYLPVEHSKGSIVRFTGDILKRLREGRDDSPLHDRVFFSFLAGRNPALALPLPRKVLDLQGSSVWRRAKNWPGHLAVIRTRLGLRLSRITGVLFEPGKTFAAIAAQPGWLLPTVVLILLQLGYYLAIGARIGWAEAAIHQLANSARGTTMTPEQLDSAAGTAYRLAPLTYALGLIFTPLYYLITAVAVRFMMRLLGGRGVVRFKQVIAVVAYSGVSTMATTCLSTARLLLTSAPDKFDIQNALPSNLAEIMGPGASKLVDSLMGSLDLFSLWNIYLIATGLEAAAGGKLSFSRALLSIILPWLLWVAYKAFGAGGFV